MRGRFGIKILLGLALCILISCGHSNRSQIAMHLANAEKFFSSGQYREAIIEYNNVIQLAPAHKLASKKLALSFLAVDEVGLAVEFLQRSKGLDPADCEVRVRLAEIYLMYDQSEESRKEVDFVLEKKPGDLEALELLAKLAETPAQITDALERLDKTDSGVRDSFRYHLALGILLMKEGDLPKAEDALNEALKADPDQIDPHLALGDLAMQKKDFRQAESEFETAARLAPENAKIQIKLCDLYILTKNFDAAGSIMERVIEKSPEMLPVLHRLAIISLERQKPDECAGYLETIFKNNPSDSEGIFIRGRLALAGGDAAKAISDFQTVLGANPQYALAHYFLGLASLQVGDTAQARASLKEALRLDPGLTDAEWNLALIAIKAGAFDEACAGLIRILQREPRDLDALTMLAEAAHSSEGISDALRRLRDTEADYGNTTRFRLAMGALLLKANDLVGSENSFNEALAIDPDSVEAHWALGGLYVEKKDLKNAELEYRKASEIGHDKPAPQLKIAEFYIRKGDIATAKNILGDCVTRFPDYAPAYRRLAAIVLEQRNSEELAALIDSIFQINPADFEAHILKGRMDLAENRPADAINDFQEAGQLNPGTAEVPYWIGIACLQSGDVEGAKARFREALSIDPGSADARMRLAEVDLRRGAYQTAINSLESMFENRAKPPEALRTLGAAYFGKGDWVRSAGCYAELLKTYPYDVQGLYFLGVSLRRQGKIDEAAGYLEKAARVAPDLVDPVVELTGIYISENKTGQALDLVGKRLEASPGNARLYLLLGTLLASRKEWNEAEAAILHGIETDPMLSPCYLELAKVYLASGRSDQALTKLEEGIARDPQNTGLHMLCATIYQQRRDTVQARREYEKVIELDPNHIPALNNLAYICAVDLEEYDNGLRMARRAKELAPDNPRIADTLGWVLYKQGNAEWALGYVRESASKLPENPEIQYHLGMVYLKIGNTVQARQAFDKVLELDPDFPAANEIRQAIADSKETSETPPN
jgi:tetratricopeptide (TPR) repeat protein